MLGAGTLSREYLPDPQSVYMELRIDAEPPP